MRAGREGICGGALKGSRLLLPKALMGWPGREGMGGATKEGVGLREGGPGVGPLTAGGLLGGGADVGGLRWGVGLQRTGK